MTTSIFGQEPLTHQEIMFGIFEHHIDTFILQDDLPQRDKVFAPVLGFAIPRLVDNDTELSVERYFANSRLRYPRIGCSLAFLVRFELFDGIEKWLRRI